MDEKIIALSLHCGECGEMYETAVEASVLTEVECPSCGQQYEVTLTVDKPST